jgi:hypothetical protein
MVDYYRDMWPLRSHLLAPLSSMTSAKVKWKWTPECQDSFEKIMAKKTLVTFPDITKEFKIHTEDASKLQLGACISQGGKPVAFYSCKLQPAQTCYCLVLAQIKKGVSDPCFHFDTTKQTFELFSAPNPAYHWKALEKIFQTQSYLLESKEN